MSAKHLTVTALTKYIKQKLETDRHLKNIWLQGEISNFNHHNRGHMYLTIKDEQSRIRAVMFAHANRRLKFVPENGMKVIIRGEVGVFQPYGQYQLYIRQMEPDGLGALHVAYEQLKEKLEKKGLFEQKHKQKIPVFPQHIGIITSPTGAAVRDIITTIRRRYPITKMTIIPAVVQGESGAKSLQQAIEKAHEKSLFDVLIIGRGGGSIEELWNFNEERVAKAIFAAKIPIISAVGHETDHTIADFVADVRAPTPTAAAEMAVPAQADLLANISRLRQSLQHMLKIKLTNLQKHLQYLKQSYAFRYPDQLIKQKEQELDRHNEQLDNAFLQMTQVKAESFSSIHKRLRSAHPQLQIDQSIKQFQKGNKQLHRSMEQYLKVQENRLALLIEKLTLLNPLEVMKRGFAIPYTEEGEIIFSKKQVATDDRLTVQVKDGRIACEVLEVKEGTEHES